jgi:hypothetical protein
MVSLREVPAAPPSRPEGVNRLDILVRQGLRDMTFPRARHRGRRRCWPAVPATNFAEATLWQRQWVAWG